MELWKAVFGLFYDSDIGNTQTDNYAHRFCSPIRFAADSVIPIRTVS